MLVSKNLSWDLGYARRGLLQRFGGHKKILTFRDCPGDGWGSKLFMCWLFLGDTKKGNTQTKSQEILRKRFDSSGTIPGLSWTIPWKCCLCVSLVVFPVPEIGNHWNSFPCRVEEPFASWGLQLAGTPRGSMEIPGDCLTRMTRTHVAWSRSLFGAATFCRV